MADTIAEELGRELLEIHIGAYGTSADSVRVHLLGDDVIVFLDGLKLQRNEEFLIEKGREDLVLATRHAFQQSIESTFRAAVERATGRTVTAFLSTTHLDPDFSIEAFRLAPAAAGDPGLDPGSGA
jgi:uncharacterized protein YbcI